jgi:hypothetical protein
MYVRDPNMEVAILASRLGIREPQLEVQLPHGSSYRAVNAELHKLAAAVELATPAHERWIVHTEPFYGGRGRVYLELFEGSAAEIARAMAVLKKLAD